MFNNFRVVIEFESYEIDECMYLTSQRVRENQLNHSDYSSALGLYLSYGLRLSIKVSLILAVMKILLSLILTFL